MIPPEASAPTAETMPLPAIAEQVKNNTVAYFKNFGLVENKDFRITATVNGKVRLTVELNNGHNVGNYLPSFRQLAFIMNNNIDLTIKNATIFTRQKAAAPALTGKRRR